MPLTPPSDSQLCSSCAHITLPALKGDDGYAHLSNARTLPRSARTCTLCHLLLHEMLQKPNTTSLDTPEPYSNLDFVLSERGVIAEDHVAIKLKWNEGLLRYFLVIKRQQDAKTVDESEEDSEETWLQVGRHSLRVFRPLSSYKIRRRIDSDHIPEGHIVSEVPNSHVIALTNYWLDECVNTHEHCQSDISDRARPLPTRLLDVGTLSSHKVQLCHTAGQVGQYTALSYCWGTSPQLRTTKSTVHTHTTNIPFDDFPATCRNAISITRSIGLRYLWIDALCIIQDDPADWSREAVKMGSVYSNAHITLAASCSPTSASGFLIPRIEDKVAKISPPGVESFYIGRRHSFAEDTDRSPLARRAWVLQERVLSRRTLHFTITQVYWECWTHHQGEDLDSLYPGVLKKDAYPEFLATSATSHSSYSSHQTQKLPIPRQWWYLLTSYTSCDLTYHKDRLVAISGLIDYISQHTGQKAIAGIFENSLHPGLLWSACNKPLQAQSAVKFPSWSWASRIGRINHVQLYQWARNDEASLITPCGTNDGDAKLSATLRRLRHNVTYGHMESSDEYRSFPPELDYHVVNFRFVSPDWIDDGDEEGLGWLTLDADSGRAPDWSLLGWAVVACGLDLPESPDSDEDTSASGEGVSQKPKEGPFYCLLVQSKTGGEYERVGIGAVKSLSWFDSSKEGIVIA